MSLDHPDNRDLLIQTATNVQWIKETMERQSSEQAVFNTTTTEKIDKVKSRVWMITGGLITAQGLVALYVAYVK